MVLFAVVRQDDLQSHSVDCVYTLEILYASWYFVQDSVTCLKWSMVSSSADSWH